nr:MAG TPA: hypothetical protein [Caudoviricetes sp.]DAM70965.1 MAG TPA: hypothetical protein [Caudoviricetes sp.]
MHYSILPDGLQAAKFDGAAAPIAPVRAITKVTSRPKGGEHHGLCP